jgi:hypothetical protein
MVEKIIGWILVSGVSVFLLWILFIYIKDVGIKKFLISLIGPAIGLFLASVLIVGLMLIGVIG